jgi:hypothetical protein
MAQSLKALMKSLPGSSLTSSESTDSELELDSTILRAKSQEAQEVDKMRPMITPHLATTPHLTTTRLLVTALCLLTLLRTTPCLYSVISPLTIVLFAAKTRSLRDLPVTTSLKSMTGGPMMLMTLVRQSCPSMRLAQRRTIRHNA